jgi:hypothetical protein
MYHPWLALLDDPLRADVEGLVHQKKAWSDPAAVGTMVYLSFTMLIPKSSLPCINVPLLPIIPKPVVMRRQSSISANIVKASKERT